jgi:hypothetical protein
MDRDYRDDLLLTMAQLVDEMLDEHINNTFGVWDDGRLRSLQKLMRAYANQIRGDTP